MNKLAKLLRRWADKLDPPTKQSFNPIISKRELKRYRMEYRVNARDVDFRRARMGVDLARYSDILRQEAIVKSAIGLSRAVHISHERDEIVLTAEFYLDERLKI